MLNVVQALESTFDEVSYMDFYRDIFPVGSFEQKGIYARGMYNGIGVCIGKGQKKVKRLTVTDDLEAIDVMAASDNFCLMSPISYIGKSRKAENARFMYALAIDLDGIETLKQWQFLMEQIEYGHEMLGGVWGLPKPTYIVSSGTGVHLYFVFERPIPLFDNIVKQLEVLKRRLTWQAWTQGASSLHDDVQYESLFQGFRVVGTITKTGTRCRAFKVGEKITVEYLNKYVPADYRATNFTYRSDLPLQKAKTLYPEWYEKRIVQKRPRGTWTCKRDLYDWWIRTLLAGALEGHRYWCLFALSAYAVKCGIPQEELEKDAFSLMPILSQRGDPFTEDDVLAALEAFEDGYAFYPIDKISERTGIPIQKNRRNYRKQAQHVQIMNAIRDIEYPNGSWREGNGRKPKRAIVQQWRKDHPDGRKIDCERDTGLSRHTILKWWDFSDIQK